MAKFGIKYGKSIFKFLKKILKKAKPNKGGPKATKNNPKATKGVADADSTSVSQESVGTGSKIMGNVWLQDHTEFLEYFNIKESVLSNFALLSFSIFIGTQNKKNFSNAMMHF